VSGFPAKYLECPISKAAFLNLSFLAEPPKYFFISRGTPAYENVYRPEKVNSRGCN